jgi:hypothetical protein
MKLCAPYAILLLGLAFPVHAAHQHGAHEHGLARLNIAVEEGGLTIELDSPLESLIGFEHAPATEAQRLAVRDMAGRLRRADAIFILTPAARCTPVSVTLESEVLDPALLAEPAPAATPAPPGTEHADHGEAEHGHGDLEAMFEFACAEPGRLNSVNVRLFETYSGLREIEAQLVAPGGQSSAELTPEATTLRW